MTPRPDIAWTRHIARTSVGELALWTLAALLMLAAHAGAGWWAMREPPIAAADDSPPAAIMIDLAPEAMAPAPVEEEQISEDQVDSMAAEAPPTLAPVEPTDMAEPVETAEPVEPVPVEQVTEPQPEVAEPLETEPLEPVDELEAVQPVETAALAEVEPETVAPVEPVETAEPVDTEPDSVEPVEDVIEPVPPDVTLPEERVEIPIPVVRPNPPRPQPDRARPQREVERKATPRRAQKRPPPAPSRQATRAQVQAQEAPRAAAPQTSSGAASVSPARWQSRVLAHLERRKRYPAEARRQRREGTAQVRFTIDANGNVGSVSLSRSSGVPELDREVLAMVRRASPVPAPPPGVGRTIVVPVRFSLR